jgi:endonuclease G, mitochondrial
MNLSERASRLRNMLEQVTPTHRLEDVHRPKAEQPLRDMGFAGFPGLEGGADADRPAERQAESGLDKLARGVEPTAAEMFALEAIVLPVDRPVVFVRGTSYDDAEAPWMHLNEVSVKNRLGPFLRSVGRVDVPGAPWVQYGGTGFIVGPNLLMTNRHVARLFVEGVGTKNLRYRSGDAAVDFNREVGTPEGDRSAFLTVQEVVMVHPFWDMALLRVEGLEDREPLTLSTRKLEVLEEAEVVAVGYPARDDRNDLALQDKIFKRTYNVKRLQPGRLKTRGRIRSFENVVSAVTHDSSTLGGNSGSAVFDLATGHVVGLHFAGIYLKANYAVPTYELARDPRLMTGATRLNFSGAVPGGNDWEPSWTALEQTSPVARTEPDSGSQINQSVSAASSGMAMTWTIPLHVTVSLGPPQAGVGAAAQLAPAAAVQPAIEAPRLQTPIVYAGLENRTGYQATFLELDGGEEVPLPALTAAGLRAAAKQDDGEMVLPYHKFSIVMHQGRRLAMFTAANVDWRPESRTVKASRSQLTGIPQGTAEKWVTDWRIDSEHQLPDVFFTKDRGAFDKGHLVRRDDVCWGPDFKDVQKSNGDTYHTTNCSPQVAGFNQGSQGEDNWGDLENLIQTHTRAQKAIILAGPVLDDDDPVFEGVGDDGPLQVRIPRRFWKIVVVKGEAGPQAYGFVLDQDLSAIEGLDIPPNWRRHMRSIAEIEELLNGLARLSWMERYDQYGTAEGVAIARALV